MSKYLPMTDIKPRPSEYEPELVGYESEPIGYELEQPEYGLEQIEYEPEQLEAVPGWKTEAFEYLQLLASYGGDVYATLSEIAQEYGVKASDLIQAADQAGKEFAKEAAQAAYDDFPSVAADIAKYIARYSGLPLPEPVIDGLGWLVMIALKAAMRQEDEAPVKTGDSELKWSNIATA